MAKKLAEFDWSWGNEKYPWDEWFDGNIWELTSPKDFDGTTASFRITLFNAAKRRGLKVRTRVLSDTKLVIQTFKED